jgi:hypothetical protein
MKRVKKIFFVFAGFIGLGLSFYFIYLAYKNPSFEIIFGAIAFALFGLFSIFEGTNFMKKIDKMKIKIGK